MSGVHTGCRLIFGTARRFVLLFAFSGEHLSIGAPHTFRLSGVVGVPMSFPALPPVDAVFETMLSRKRKNYASAVYMYGFGSPVCCV